MLCVCWGWVLACYAWLSPLNYLLLSLVLALSLSGFLFFWRRHKPTKGHFRILANQAYFERNGKTYQVQFESYNAWRLLGRLTLEDKQTQLPIPWSAYLTYPYYWQRFKRLISRPHDLTIYHSMLSSKEYAFLRSFAAYQCHMRTQDKPLS